MLAAALTACGASAAGRTRPIRFGLAGGNIAGYTVSIRPDGRVTVDGVVGISHRKIAARRVRRLGREIRNAHLAKSRVCPGTLPDVGAEFIRLGSRTFTRRGTCEPRFQRVWDDLLRAVGRLP